MSKTKKRIFRRASVTTSFIAAIGSMTLLGAACEDRVACGGLVGSYVTSITDKEGVFSSRGLMTFTSDGLLVISDSAQGGVPGLWDPFSTAQGAWKCLAEEGEKLSISAVGLNFVLPPDGGSPSIGRVDYLASLDTRTGNLSGSAKLRFTPDEDLESAAPVDNPGDLADEFDIEGVRVVIKE
jgi:hypothetical protein